jgi:hypothetical protein
MTKKSCSWDFIIPGDTYSGRFNYSKLVSEREVRADLRRYYGVSRLPKGTDVYVLGPQAREIIRKNMKEMADTYHKAGQIADF